MGNLIRKEHSWYVLTDNQILAPKLGIPKKQITELMKPKEKEGQKVDASVLFRMENKTLRGGNKGTNRGARIGEKIIQRLPHLGIHPICSH